MTVHGLMEFDTILAQKLGMEATNFNHHEAVIPVDKVDLIPAILSGDRGNRFVQVILDKNKLPKGRDPTICEVIAACSFKKTKK